MEAQSNYNIAIKDLFIVGCFTTRISNCRNCQKSRWIFSNISRDVRKKFKNEQLIQILDFQFFPWRKTSDTPSFYSFMNYADFGLERGIQKTGMYDSALWKV
jgi:phytoene desaturase